MDLPKCYELFIETFSPALPLVLGKKSPYDTAMNKTPPRSLLGAIELKQGNPHPHELSEELKTGQTGEIPIDSIRELLANRKRNTPATSEELAAARKLLERSNIPDEE